MQEEVVSPEKSIPISKIPSTETPKVTYEIPESKTISQENKIKAFSLKSIQQKKELLAQIKPEVLEETVHLAEPFTENDLMVQWNKFAQKMEAHGEKMIYSLFTLHTPTLKNETTIVHKVPNASSKMEFDRIKGDLLGYLRGMLHNHYIQLELVEDEHVAIHKAYTIQDKYQRFVEINPTIELLRKTFDLDFN